MATLGTGREGGHRGREPDGPDLGQAQRYYYSPPKGQTLLPVHSFHRNQHLIVSWPVSLTIQSMNDEHEGDSRYLSVST